jgi:hypothetical protein
MGHSNFGMALFLNLQSRRLHQMTSSVPTSAAKGVMGGQYQVTPVITNPLPPQSSSNSVGSQFSASHPITNPLPPTIQMPTISSSSGETRGVTGGQHQVIPVLTNPLPTALHKGLPTNSSSSSAGTRGVVGGQINQIEPPKKAPQRGVILKD